MLNKQLTKAAQRRINKAVQLAARPTKQLEAACMGLKGDSLRAKFVRG